MTPRQSRGTSAEGQPERSMTSSADRVRVPADRRMECLRHRGAWPSGHGQTQRSTHHHIQELTTALGIHRASSTSSDVTCAVQESGDTEETLVTEYESGSEGDLIALGPRSPPHLPIVTSVTAFTRLLASTKSPARGDRGVAHDVAATRDRPALKLLRLGIEAHDRIRRRSGLAVQKPMAFCAGIRSSGLPCMTAPHIRASSRGTVDQGPN